MEVEVQIQCVTETLHERHGAAVRMPGSATIAHPTAQGSEHCPHKYGKDVPCQDLGLPGFYGFANTTSPTAESYGVKQGDGSLSDPNGVVDYEDTNFQHDFPYFQELAIDTRTGAQASAYRHYVMNDVNGFVNDDWKISPRLTLNLGLRWERFGAPREVNGILAQFTNLNCVTKECVAAARVGPADRMWNTRNRDFAPRVGFAWDIFGKGGLPCAVVTGSPVTASLTMSGRTAPGTRRFMA